MATPYHLPLRECKPLLRPYQSKVIVRAAAEIEAGKRRLIVVAPTGAGKTVIAAALTTEAVTAGRRALILVHRRELLQQASRKLHDVGIDHGIVAAGFPARPHEPVQVGSIPTLHVRAVRGSAMELPAADVLIVDEAHHATARTWRRIIEAYPDAVLLGLTATPCRADGTGLGGIFDTMIECPQIPELIDGGYLVPTQVYAPTRPDLDGVHVRAGDYVEAELADRMDRPKLVGDVVEHWLRLAKGKRTLVYAVNISHSVHIRDEFRHAGVLAEHLDGTTPVEERDAILARLASGAIDVVCNVGVLTEGVDVPAVQCIVIARPTKSLVLFRQMVGRGLRPADGKAHCLVMDHADATREHGLVEDPVEWSLAPEGKARNVRHEARRSGRAEMLATCPECSAIRLSGHPCSSCGWRPTPKPQAIEVEDGELGQVDCDRNVRLQTPTFAEKARFHGELTWIARQRGYKDGWASHKHKEKFGTWPVSRHAVPLQPRPETLAWVRSRAIAWKMAQRQTASAGAA